MNKKLELRISKWVSTIFFLFVFPVLFVWMGFIAIASGDTKIEIIGVLLFIIMFQILMFGMIFNWYSEWLGYKRGFGEIRYFEKKK